MRPAFEGLDLNECRQLSTAPNFKFKRSGGVFSKASLNKAIAKKKIGDGKDGYLSERRPIHLSLP